MRIDVLTLFPEAFDILMSVSILRRAVEDGKVLVKARNIRDYTHDRHKTVDDAPYGGGAGMVMKPEPVFEAVEAIKTELGEEAAAKAPVVLLTPQGRLFNQQVARELSAYDNLVLVCGHYEGVDERIREHLATDEISIGDYVLTGGELPAMVVIDAVVRLLPGVIAGASLLDESHAGGLLEYPQYTRPPEFRGWEVPEILLSGDHARIARWRREQVILRTLKRRPELLASAELASSEKRLVESLLASAGQSDTSSSKITKES